jgi:hypothetical protein
MRKLALVALLLAASCASNTLKMPECWLVESPWGSGSSVPFMRLDGKLWLITAKHNLPLATVGGMAIIDQLPHSTLDIALITVADTDARLISFAAVDPKLGDRLYAMGYHARQLLITSGYSGDTPGFMSCPIYYGASGGPVWNSSGELVGIVKGVWRIKTPKNDIQVIPHISVYTSVVGLQEWIDSITG